MRPIYGRRSNGAIIVEPQEEGRWYKVLYCRPSGMDEDLLGVFQSRGRAIAYAKEQKEMRR